MPSSSRVSPASDDAVISSAAELMARGISQSSIVRARAAGRLHRVGHGLYSTSADPDRLELASRSGVLSHGTAAALWGLDLLEDPGLHVTAPHRLRAVPVAVLSHRGRLDPDEVARLSGRRVTSPTRTIADCVRVFSEPAGVVLVDSALRTGLATGTTLARLARESRGPRSVRVRRAVTLSDPSSESALETLTRLLFHAHDLQPLTQARITDRNGFVARVDFLFEEARLVVEADGFTFHANRGSFNDDRHRQNALARAGYTVVRFSWEDVVARPDYVIATVRSLLSPAA